MKKRSLIFLLCLFLVGCNQSADIKTSLDAIISEEVNNGDIYRQDHNSVYFSYYLPSDIYIIEASRNVSILSFNQDRILMNLNITSIIADQNKTKNGFFESTISYKKDYLIYQNKGIYRDYDDIECHYDFEVYEINEHYLLNLKTDDMCYYAYTTIDNVELLTKRLFSLAESMSMNRELIISDYSNFDAIDYRRQQINLFETIIPQEGKVEDIIVDKDKHNSTNSQNENIAQ